MSTTRYTTVSSKCTFIFKLHSFRRECCRLSIVTHTNRREQSKLILYNTHGEPSHILLSRKSLSIHKNSTLSSWHEQCDDVQYGRLYKFVINVIDNILKRWKMTKKKLFKCIRNNCLHILVLQHILCCLWSNIHNDRKQRGDDLWSRERLHHTKWDTNKMAESWCQFHERSLLQGITYAWEISATEMFWCNLYHVLRYSILYMHNNQATTTDWLNKGTV